MKRAGWRAGRAADRLSLKGVVCQCHIGVTEEERRDRQRIEVDLDLFADLEEAGRTGDLDLTIDYRRVCEEARGYLESGTFRLVEAAACGVAAILLDRFPVSRVAVRVRKFVLPQVAHVEVGMEREQSGRGARRPQAGPKGRGGRKA